MPCAPIGPESKTLSPGRIEAGSSLARSSVAPIPNVETYIPSAAPCSTTFVSPPTIGTPAFRAAIAIASISLSSVLEGSPASRMSVAIKATGRAADTARSFSVPFTASSPIEPPGKRSGFTTNPSALVAIRVPPIESAAASENACSTGLAK